MPIALTTLLAVFAILALLRIAPQLIGYHRLRQFEIDLDTPLPEPIGREQVPEVPRRLLDAPTPRLAALGFAPCDSLRITPNMHRGTPLPVYADRYYHAETRTHALVLPTDLPEPGATALVGLETPRVDGSTLLTFNRYAHLVLPQPPQVRIADDYLTDLEAQWALHRRRLAEPGPEALPTAEALYARTTVDVQARYDHWRQQGVIVPDGPGRWRLGRRAAWQYVRAIVAGMRRLAKLPTAVAATSDPDLPAADLRAYHLHEAFEAANAPGRGFKTGLFGVSAVAGVAAFGLMFGWQALPVLVPVLVGVLLVHEFGHALAMHLTGYRNLQVLMLPFLGAVALGRKDDAGPWTRLLVLFAGPLPGLIVAVLLYRLDLAAHSPWLAMVAATALLLNLFNLLPITPLDGGQIVETCLFTRWPRLRFVFSLGSVIALAGVGLWLDSTALYILAALMLFSLRATCRHLRLAASVGPVATEDAPAAIFAALYRLPALAARPFNERRQTVRAVLPLVVARPPRAWEGLLGIALYVAVIVLPLALLQDVPVAQRLLTSLLPETRPAPRDWDAELAQAATPEARWSLLIEAGGALADAEDNVAAEVRLQQALVVAQGFAPDDLRRLDTRLALAQGGDPDQAVARLQALLPELRDLHGVARRRLAAALEEIDGRDDAATPAARIAGLTEALAIREGSTEAEDQMPLIWDRHQIAALRCRLGEVAEAEALLRANLAELPESHQVEPLAWLLVDTGRGAEALALLDASPEGGEADSDPDELRDVRAWALQGVGRTDEARRLLLAALEEVPKARRWGRALRLLDVLALGDDPEVRDEALATWQQPDMDGLADHLDWEGDTAPWMRIRNQGRRKALAGLRR